MPRIEAIDPVQDNWLSQNLLIPLEKATGDVLHGEMSARYGELLVDYPQYLNPDFYPDPMRRTWQDGTRANYLDTMSQDQQSTMLARFQSRESSSLTRDAYAEALRITDLAMQGYIMWQRGEQIPELQEQAMRFRDFAIEAYRERVLVAEMVNLNDGIRAIARTRRRLRSLGEKAGRIAAESLVNMSIRIPFATDAAKAFIRKVGRANLKEAKQYQGGGVFDGGQFYNLVLHDDLYAYKMYGKMIRMMRKHKVKVPYPEDGERKTKWYNPEKTDDVIEALYTLLPVTEFCRERKRLNGAVVPGYNAISFLQLKKQEWEEHRLDMIRQARTRR